MNLSLAESEGKDLRVVYSALVTTGELCLRRCPSKTIKFEGERTLPWIREINMDQDVAIRRSCSTMSHFYHFLSTQRHSQGE